MRSVRFFALLFALQAGATVLLAQSDGEPRLTADFGYASRHVFRGVERAGSSAQASVEYAANGFRGTVWANRPLRGGQVGEIDLTAAYGHQMSDRLKVELALTAYRFTNVPAGATGHSLEAGLVVTGASINGFVPRVSLRHDFRLAAHTVEAGLAYSLPLTKLGAFLEFSAFTGWTDGSNLRPDAAGPRVSEGYGFVGTEVRLPYRVGTHTTVIAGLEGATTLNHSGAFAVSGRSARTNLSLSLSVSFDF